VSRAGCGLSSSEVGHVCFNRLRSQRMQIRSERRTAVKELVQKSHMVVFVAFCEILIKRCRRGIKTAQIPYLRECVLIASDQATGSLQVFAMSCQGDAKWKVRDGCRFPSDDKGAVPLIRQVKWRNAWFPVSDGCIFGTFPVILKVSSAGNESGAELSILRRTCWGSWHGRG